MCRRQASGGWDLQLSSYSVTWWVNWTGGRKARYSLKAKRQSPCQESHRIRMFISLSWFEAQMGDVWSTPIERAFQAELGWRLCSNQKEPGSAAESWGCARCWLQSVLDSATYASVCSGDSFWHWNQPDSVSIVCYQTNLWWNQMLLVHQVLLPLTLGTQLDYNMNSWGLSWTMEYGRSDVLAWLLNRPQKPLCFLFPKQGEPRISK